MKIKEILYKMILIGLLILVIYVTYDSIFKVYRMSENLVPIVIILGTIVMVFLMIRIKKLLCNISEKKADVIAIITCIVFLILLAVFGNLVTSVPTYDLSNIIGEVELMMKNGGKFVSEEYFARCTNQVPVTILLYYIYNLGKIIGFTDLAFFSMLVNALFISITALFTYLSVKKLRNHSTALMILIFFVLNPIFYIYTSYFYTDVLCMPFASIAIYLYILSEKSHNTKKKFIAIFFSGLFIAIGTEIRVVVAILLIGIIMSIILHKKIGYETIINTIIIIIGFIIGISLYMLISKPFGVIKNKDLELPIYHYVMYSLNEKYDGRWNIEDYMYTYSQDTHSKKVEANTNMIKKRLKSLRLKGWILLSKEKLAVNWSNGTYDYFPKFLNVKRINKLYEYIVGNKKIFVMYYCQICKATTMLLFMLAVINKLIKKEKDNDDSAIYISMFGAFVFYLLWEVSERYSLTFLPWILLLVSAGIDQIEIAIKENIVVKGEWIIKILATSTIFCSIFLLAVNYYDYTGKKSVKWDKAVMQYKDYGIFNPNLSENTIKQTFKTDKPFNCISIKFKKKENVSGRKYSFILRDENEQILTEQEFSSKTIKEEQLNTFHFKKIEPKKEKKYIIEIASRNTTEVVEKLSLATFNDGQYSAYPDGEMMINDEKVDSTLVFQVQNEIRRPYVRKSIYLGLCFIIIAIEIFVFWPAIINMKINKKHNL